MTEQAGFYSDYFTRSTFLSAEASPETARLASWGFTDPAQFAAKRVLEVGAGAGRLTRALAEHGFIQRAAEYTVLEPSAGIEPLRREIDLPNVRFIRAPLQSAGIAPASVDYLIASGVLPHLADEPLADRIGRLARLLGPAGRLHVTASWYGHPKRAAFALKRLARRAPATARALAWITAGLQTLCCDWLPARALFVPRFIYSFERTLGRRADQQLEFLRVEPYLFDGYAGYSAALAEHWLGFERLFPYSIAFIACRLGGPVPIGRPRGRVAILGHDWSGRWASRRIAGKLVATVDEAAQHDSVVIAYDYTAPGERPYHGTVAELERRGFVLGDSLFLFQMLV